MNNISCDTFGFFYFFFYSSIVVFVVCIYKCCVCSDLWLRSYSNFSWSFCTHTTRVNITQLHTFIMYRCIIYNMHTRITIPTCVFENKRNRFVLCLYTPMPYVSVCVCLFTMGVKSYKYYVG